MLYFSVMHKICRFILWLAFVLVLHVHLQGEVEQNKLMDVFLK